jgi:hypothetical protein
MKNTTKLKIILQLNTVTFDMDNDGNLNMAIIDKRNGEKQTFIHQNYTAIVRMAFSYMNKKLKEPIK